MKMISAITLVSALLLSLVAASAEEKQMDHDMKDHKGMDHKGMDHKGMGHKGMKHEGMMHKDMDHGSMKHGQMGAKVAAGVGVINSVDADTRVVNLTHEPMPELGWPTMTMDLPAMKRVDLGSLKNGDKVDFKLKLGRDKQYRIIEIAPAK